MIEETTPPLDVMRQIYQQNFSLHYIKGNFKEKIAVISLLCYLHHEIKKKKSISFYELIMKIDETLPIDFIKSLSIICEDFAYECTEFENFGVEIKNIPSTLKEIFKKILPF